MLTDPADIKAVFTGSPDELRAGEANALLEPFLGRHSLLLLDGQHHLRERKLMLPPFHGERMRLYEEVMAKEAIKNLETWPIGSPFPALPYMPAITFEVILRTVFGLDAASGLDRLRAPMRRFLKYAGSVSLLLPQFHRDLGAWSPWGRFLRLRHDVDGALYREIRDRRAASDLDAREDILSLLILAEYDDGRRLTDQELRDELMTLLIAGHETTASGLAWTLDLLLHHPNVMDRLLQELGSGSDTYLDAVIKESLRVRPVVIEVGRRLRQPMTLKDRDLPAGVLAVAQIYLVHRRADIYPDPDAFRPERFLEKAPETYSWIPFGGGTRRCLGAAFATAEMRVVLRTILSRALLRAGSSRLAGPRRRIVTVVPRRGTRVILEKTARRVEAGG